VHTGDRSSDRSRGLQDVSEHQRQRHFDECGGHGVLVRLSFKCRCHNVQACRSIVLEENPLADFVELPDHLQELR
jgi:hypothetical protein